MGGFSLENSDAAYKSSEKPLKSQGTETSLTRGVEEELLLL